MPRDCYTRHARLSRRPRRTELGAVATRLDEVHTAVAEREGAYQAPRSEIVDPVLDCLVYGARSAFSRFDVDRAGGGLAATREHVLLQIAHRDARRAAVEPLPGLLLG